MFVDTKSIKAVTDENQNPHRAGRDNKPQTIQLSDDEKIESVAARILQEHRKAFEELAK